MKFCPFCGAEMPEILTLCPACGKETPQAPTGDTETSWEEISKRFDLDGADKPRTAVQTSPLSSASAEEEGVMTPILGSRFGLARPDFSGSEEIEGGTVVDVVLPASMIELAQIESSREAPDTLENDVPPPPPLDHLDEPSASSMPLPTPPDGTPSFDRPPTPPKREAVSAAPSEGGDSGGRAGMLFAIVALALGFLVMVGAGSLAWFYFMTPTDNNGATASDTSNKKPASARTESKKTRKTRPKAKDQDSKPPVRDPDKDQGRNQDKDAPRDTPIASERPKIFAAGLVDVKGFRAERLRGFVHADDLVSEPSIGVWAVVQIAGIDALVVPSVEGNNPPVQAALIATELIKIVEAHRDQGGGVFEVFPTGPTIQIVWRGGDTTVPLVSVEEGELAALSLFDDPVPGNLDRARHLAAWLTLLMNAVVLGEVPASLGDGVGGGARDALVEFVKLDGDVSERADKMAAKRLKALNRMAYITPR